jgi:hypothetical protein
MIPPGWKITRKALNPFKAIEIVAPNGWGAVVCEHEFNPGNVLYMLADTLLNEDIVVTTDYSGAVVLVSRQNDEGQITEVLWEGKP